VKPPAASAAPGNAPAAEVALCERAAAIDALLPQTQCTRCGFPDCHAYALAIAGGEADINRCPPGGAQGIVRLAALTGRAVKPLDPEHGTEAPRRLARIDEDWCIGCTLCIKACPVDCIVGASKQMHTVIESLCTGCDLCLPVCPVDCIEMFDASGSRTGWDAWSPPQAEEARQRYAFHRMRVERDRRENDERLAAKAEAKLADLQGHSKIDDPETLQRKRAVIEAALARAKAARKP
jgi:electron transport complex protein RnfB